MAPAKPPQQLGPSAHVDTFTRDNLPPIGQWPTLLLDRPEFKYPERLNIAIELTDVMVERGFGDHIALIGNGRRRTYKELADWSAKWDGYYWKHVPYVVLGDEPPSDPDWYAVVYGGAKRDDGPRHRR